MASDIGRLGQQLEALNRRTTGRLAEVTLDEEVPWGERFRFEGDYRRMLQLQRQLEDYPNDFETLVSLGNLLQRNNKFQKAESYLLKALALEPLNQGLLSNLAELYFEKGEDTKTWETFQEIIYLNPDNIDAHAAKGRIRERGGNFSGAEAIYRQIEGKFGNVVQVYAHRTLNLAQQGNYGDAVALAREGLAIYPDHAPLYYARGQAYQGLGLLDRARIDYYDALALDPDMLVTYSAVGDVALQERNAVTAMKAYLRILDMRPGDPAASLGLGKGYLMDLRFREAVDELEMLRYLHPEYAAANDWQAQAYYLRSLQLQEQGYPRQALDLHRMAFSLAGSGSNELVVAALLMAGDGALSHDDYPLAVKYFKLTLDNDPFNIEGYLGLGYAFRALGEVSRARATFQQALILDPGHPGARTGFDQLSQP
ncbi:tetratricopeptide repeat protein [Candidatus Neomarinimicrobiota bacterium]